MAGYLVVVEDDHLQEGPLEDHLREAFPSADVQTVPTEKDFRRLLPQLRERPPDAVVLDVMLRWEFPSRDSPPPPADVESGGYYRAGLRCAQLLAADDRLRGVPVVFYTILERADLDRDGVALADTIRYVRKSSDLDVLTRALKESIRAHG
jgi:CheY-like chemotaxis protein